MQASVILGGLPSPSVVSVSAGISGSVERPSVHFSRHFPAFRGTLGLLRPQFKRRAPVQSVASATEVQQAQNGKPSASEVPRSPYNTGSSDMATAGPGTSLVNHPLEYEKTVVFVRHGMTTWNEQKRIQV